MKRKPNLKRFVVACAISGFIVPAFAIAQPDTLGNPVYSTSSEAIGAQQVAQQDAKGTHATLDKSLDKIQELETQRKHMQGSGNSHQVMSAETALNNAENMYMDQLSSMTGVSVGDLEKMHDAGSSYGAMARELGVQVHSNQMTGQVSGAMNSGQGMGSGHDAASVGMNSNQHSQQGLTGTGGNSMRGDRSVEIMGATNRNTESGWSEGHGTGMQTDGGQGDDGGMMSGGGGLSNGMGSPDSNGHDGGGMGGGMGASGSESSGSGGSGGSGGMGGSSGGGKGGNSGGSGGGHGGGGRM